MSIPWGVFWDYLTTQVSAAIFALTAKNEELKYKKYFDKNGDNKVSEDEYHNNPGYEIWVTSYGFPKTFSELKAKIDPEPTGEQSFGSMFGTFTAITDNLKAIWTEGENEFFFALAIIILGVIAVNLFNQFRVYSNMLTRKEESLFSKLRGQVRGLFD